MTKTDPLFYQKRFAKRLEDKCFEARMNQATLAERIGMDERTFRRRKRDGLWTYPQIRNIFRVLRYSDDEIKLLMEG